MSSADVGSDAIPIAVARVLLIDDDPSIHALVAAMLKSLDVHMVCATSGADGIATAREQPPDLLLLDNDMPDVNGLDVLMQLKADVELASVPVIMVTGSESNKTLSACFAAGAIDYIRKPFTAAELRARVNSVIERQRMLAELTHAARFDKLTGLANRALLNDRLTTAIERARENPAYGFALMFLDFDRFKFVNDSLGHDIGDLLLKGIAARLRNNLRATDSTARTATGTTVARLGGDEFVIVLDGVTTPDSANSIADRLLDVLRLPYQLAGHTVRSSASIGTVYSAAGYDTAAEMLRDADIAMYEAKARGKACQVVFTADMRAAALERIDMENDLRAAIGTSQMHVAYQPIFSLDTQALVGIEALARWTHPTRGDTSPSTFIPLAEETALILPICEFVLQEACATFVRARRDAPASSLQYVSINISRVQFSDLELVERTVRALRDAGMQPNQLQLEFTESHIIQNKSVALTMLREFRTLGVRLAMDDFGTGYSSLSSLQELPLDSLKVDRVFVAQANHGREYAALLHAVITLADNLGLTVVAEGIERIEQLVLLQALGCGFGQGFLLAHPMSANALVQMVASTPMIGFSEDPVLAVT